MSWKRSGTKLRIFLPTIERNDLVQYTVIGLMLDIFFQENRTTLLQFNDRERLPLTDFQEPSIIITLVLAFFVFRPS